MSIYENIQGRKTDELASRISGNIEFDPSEKRKL